MIYLDNAATTAVDKRVLNAMLPYFTENYGNPNSVHNMGFEAYNAVENARLQVAKAVGAKAENIIFTSGATEANNLVLQNFPLRHLYCGEFEHPSVLVPTRKNCRICPSFDLKSDGCVDVEDIMGKVRGSFALVSIMLVNNETGSINAVKSIVDWCHERGVLVHSDCTQALGVMPVNVEELGVDFATFSGHKAHAPKGVGALYAKDASLLKPLFFGGNNQDLGIRPGTENVPSIVGFGKACELISEYDFEEVHYLRNALAESLLSDVPCEMSFNGFEKLCNGKILNVRFHGIDADRLMLLLSQCGVCVSKGSACSSGKSTVSPTLLAMGLSEKEASECIRFSVSRMTTVREIQEAVAIVKDCVEAIK